MRRRILPRIRYQLERFVVRGLLSQLLLVAAFMLLISLVAGAVVFFVDHDPHRPDSLSESVWWAFLRLTDPGYLGDDHGSLRRVVSTVVTILGYVLFMGSLVAILTQWLQRTMSVLETGAGSIASRDHVLVVGNNDRAQLVVGELFHSRLRLERFLDRRGKGRLHVVVMSEKSGPALRNELKLRIGSRWKVGQLTLRLGDALRPEHLSRVDFARASTVLLPSGDFTDDGPERADTHLVKTLLTMSRHPEIPVTASLPLVVAEVLDDRRVDLVHSAYRGPLETVASNAVLAQFFAQSVVHPEITRVYSALISQDGTHWLRVRRYPQLRGVPMRELGRYFDQATPIGVLVQRSGSSRAEFLFDPSYELGQDDALVLIAARAEATRSRQSPADAQPLVERERFSFSKFCARAQRVAIFGWSHKVPSLLRELSNLEDVHVDIDVYAQVNIQERLRLIEKFCPEVQAKKVQHHLIDYTVPAAFRALELGDVDHALLMGADWLEGEEEADARTIMGWLMLQDREAKGHKTPHTLVEILDPSNLSLLDTARAEVVVSSSILSYILSQVALEPELNAVFHGLFSPKGPDFSFRAPQDYGYGAKAKVRFGQFHQDAMARGECAVGVMRRQQASKAPPSVDFDFAPATMLDLGPGDRLIVLL